MPSLETVRERLPPVCRPPPHNIGDGQPQLHPSFDMMGKRLYKTYREISNIVVRVSNGTDAGKAHAILINAHLDSTLPSPGAADDALSCGVLLEAFRVLTQTPGWSPHHAIIFRE